MTARDGQDASGDVRGEGQHFVPADFLVKEQVRFHGGEDRRRIDQDGTGRDTCLDDGLAVEDVIDALADEP